MKSNRKMMLAAALVVAVVALAGAGYAAVTYKAINISDNAMSASYIETTQTGTLVTNVDFDTYVNGTADPIYILKNAGEAVASGYHGVSLGTKTLSVNPVTIEPSTVSVQVDVTGVSGWTVYIKIGSTYKTSGDTFTGVSIADAITVGIYLAGEDFIAGSHPGSDATNWNNHGSSDEAPVLTSLNVKFTVTAEV